MRSMILVAMLSTGAIEAQPMEGWLCERIVSQMAAGAAVEAERIDGSSVTLVLGKCYPDTMKTRLELLPETVGACDEGGDV